MISNKLITLGIETSCDETSVAIVREGREILSNCTYTQIPIHTKFGGVVPEIASRNHLMKINSLIQSAMDEAAVNISEIDMIAVTYGPGLIGSLLVGVAAAKSISLSTGIPLVGVNHMHGHIAANYIEHKKLEPPFVALVVSGGHTSLARVLDYNQCVVLGETRDDAAGEAFDKISRIIGLGYPGGPKLDQASKAGDPEAIDFPRVFLEPGTLDFSFSGLKTAAINYIHSLKQSGQEIHVPDICASFQEAVVDVLRAKALRALQETGINRLVLAGGVSANTRLRSVLSSEAAYHGFDLYYPSLSLCSDNAAMIACSGYYSYLAGKISDLSLDADSSLRM